MRSEGIEIKKKGRKRVGAILPEIVERRAHRWSVTEEENHSIDLPQSKMAVPFDDTKAAQDIRAQEMGHVCWTPRDLLQRTDLPPKLVEVVEDGRINAKLKDAEIDPPSWKDSPGFRYSRLGRFFSDPLMAAAIRMAVANTDDAGPVDSLLKEHQPSHAEWIRTQAERLTAEAAPEVTLDVARQIQDKLGGPGTQQQLENPTGTPWKPKNSSKKDKPEGPPFFSDEPGLQIGGFDETDLIMPGLLNLQEQAKYMEEDWGDDEIEWCPMREEAPTRPIRLIKGHGRGHRGEYYGRVPRYPHRMATDLRIFANKRGSIAYPGSVLIDLSGSMSLTDQQIEDIINMYPAAEIRVYCSNGRTGVLRTVAKNGRRVLHLQAYGEGWGQGNGVDGPALRWLAKAPRPRFWISDGGVTGIGDDMRKNLYDECIETVSRGRIIMFQAVTDFLDKFQTSRQ